MAKRGPKGPHRGSFKPGHKSKGGRPALPEHLKKVKANPSLFKAYIQKYLLTPINEIEEIWNTPEKAKSLNVLEGMVVRIIIEALDKSDITQFNYLVENVFGKNYVPAPDKDPDADKSKDNKVLLQWIDERAKTINQDK